MLSIVLIICFFKSYVYSLIGIDISISLSANDWKDVISIHQPSFSITHLLFYNSTVNTDGIKSIISGWNNNVTDISVYVYPCIESSVYATTYKVNCGSAKDQFLKVLFALQDNEIYFDKHSVSPETWYQPSQTPSANPSPTVSPNSELSESPTHLPTISSLAYVPSSLPTMNTMAPSRNKGKIVVSRMFVNIEDETPNRYFSNDCRINLQFLADFSNEALMHNVQLGVYTTKKDWHNVMTISLPPLFKQPLYLLANGSNSQTNPFATLPLWVPRYDNTASMDFFEPFAGWETVFMKQMSGGSSSARRVGSSRICTNYRPGLPRPFNAVDNSTLQRIEL